MKKLLALLVAGAFVSSVFADEASAPMNMNDAKAPMMMNADHDAKSEGSAVKHSRKHHKKHHKSHKVASAA
jgi:Ni/Co efflux regulator RcnB